MAPEARALLVGGGGGRDGEQRHQHCRDEGDNCCSEGQPGNCTEATHRILLLAPHR